MRVKVSLQNPQTTKKETHLISVPKHLKYIIDLQAHIIDRLGLSAFLETNQHTISLFIEECHLPKNEKIAELIKDEDIINVDLAPVKRSNSNPLDNLFENTHFNGNEEALLDHQFVKLMQEVSLLRNLYSRTKIRKLDEGQEQRIRIEEPVAQPTKIIYKEKLAPKAAQEKEKVQQKPQEIKKKVVQKKVIEEDSESDTEVVVVKKNVQQAKPVTTKQQLRQKKVVQEESSEESSEEEEVAPKAKSNKNKPIAEAKTTAKPAPKKQATPMEEEESEEEERAQPEPIKERKITTVLNIPTPAEAFNKKKEEWDKMPVSQWNAGKRTKEPKGPQYSQAKPQTQAQAQQPQKTAPQQQQQKATAPQTQQQQKAPAPQTQQQKTNTTAPHIVEAEVKKVVIHPPKNAAANKTQTSSTQAPSTQVKSQEAPKQQPQKKNEAPKMNAYEEFVNKSKLLKESMGQTAPPTKPQQTKPAPVIFAAPQNRNHRAPRDDEYDDGEYYDDPYQKRIIYEPNVMTADLEEVKKVKEGGSFPGFIEIPVDKLNQKWAENSALMLVVGDIVKYKCETLSSAGPTISAWREGGVVKIQKNQVVIKRSDFVPSNIQEGDDEIEEETEEDELFVHGIRSLYVKNSSLNEEREKFVKELGQEQKGKPGLLEELAEKKRKLQEELQKKIEQSEEESMKDAADYKRSRIGKQINFYFSEKNYQKDKFIRAHVDKDPERYMSISLLLNFPKIRGMTQDLGMILESIKYVLRTDPNCNYEIDETESKIKKKIL